MHAQRAFHFFVQPAKLRPFSLPSLDLQYIMSVGANVTTWFWGMPGYSSDSPENEPFLE